MHLSPLILAAAGAVLTLAPASAAEPAPPAQTAQTAQAAQPAQAKAAEAPAKLICRKEVETGSILKKRRVCYTQRQRDQAAEKSRDAVTQGLMSGGSSGN